MFRKIKSGLAVTLCSSLLMFSCTREERNPSAPEGSLAGTGSALVTIQSGRVGGLAKGSKASDINLASLEVTLTAPGETPVTQSFRLSGSGSSTISNTFQELAALKTWTLSARTLDQAGQVIHSGSTTFEVRPRQTSDVNLDLSALFSMLKARFYPVRDSVTRLELIVDGVIRDQISFAKQTRLGDTIPLAFDYLTTGASHTIRLSAYGDMWGFDTLLYSADTVLAIAAGQDASHGIILRWAGPRLPPAGEAEMRVSLGSVGTVTMNGRLEDTTTSINLAQNPLLTGFPNPDESDNGWGGGSNKWDMLDGLTGYADTWAHGLAFTGGISGYAGPCGEKQATVNLGAMHSINKVDVYHHGDEHIPNTYRIEIWDGSAWLTVFSTTTGMNYVREDLRYVGPGWSSVPTVNSFPAVSGSKVRFAVNNCDITHGWIYEFQIFGN